MSANAKEEKAVKITDVWSVEDAIARQAEWGHLYEVQAPPPDHKNWRVREVFTQGGHLLVGDLLLDEQEARFLEVHPFPEWVVQVYQPGKRPGGAYAILPKLERKVVARRLPRKPWAKRVATLNKMLGRLSPAEFFAIQYEVGTNIKIPANVPHYFLAKCASGEDLPYMQVFEPSLPILDEGLKITTPYFDVGTPYRVGELKK